MSEKVCKDCRWRSDDFTSACVNDRSPSCADFVMHNDCCDEFEEKEVKENG